MVRRWLQPPGADLLSWLWAWSPAKRRLHQRVRCYITCDIPIGCPLKSLLLLDQSGYYTSLALRLPQIFYLPYLDYLQLTSICLTFDPADLKADQKKYCTFSCGIHIYNGIDRDQTEGGCASVTRRDAYGIPTEWTIKKANKTDKHDKYFNCIGADEDFGSCCSPGSIVVPRNANPPVMTLKGFQSYPLICSNARPMLPGDPKDCMKP
ncbi:hypothetical protein H4Q26_009537 [Puccinia striiformis f. sp. tritici PST-130]|uniref:Uncharacterized protein n=1 Tax=Puccinia striiformis f. sp. tritici PST-78 TaxID=1165861 RepID=A0A0L0VHZ6_9BASI|nr:hypothetical protein H4Q26_009537 [Puccinia striiformis f. sp. tritici PST-130]KNE98910.1 hypothetical protein PSTG_07755 [Puccinia striiformis f. sp. tritici PST-78]